MKSGSSIPSPMDRNTCILAYRKSVKILLQNFNATVFFFSKIFKKAYGQVCTTHNPGIEKIFEKKYLSLPIFYPLAQLIAESIMMIMLLGLQNYFFGGKVGPH